MRSGETITGWSELAPSGGGFTPTSAFPHPFHNLRTRRPEHLRPSWGKDRSSLPQKCPQPPHIGSRLAQLRFRLARERPLRSHLRPQHPQSSPSTCRSCQELAHSSHARGHACHAMSHDRLAHNHLRHASRATHPHACTRRSTRGSVGSVRNVVCSGLVEGPREVRREQRGVCGLRLRADERAQHDGRSASWLRLRC